MASASPHLLIIEARFYDALADALLAGARDVLDGAGATYDVITVPGALEVPAVLSMYGGGLFSRSIIDENATTEDEAIHSMMEGQIYHGFVALGTVIRGDTYHFEIVANESCGALTRLAVDYGFALGNGILTVENAEQAWERADPKRGDKGGAAAQAALTMIDIRDRIGPELIAGHWRGRDTQH